VFHALATAEFLHESAKETLRVYTEAHRCAEAEYQATCESVRRKEAAASRASGVGERLPSYLITADRVKAQQAADRLRACETRLAAVHRQSVGAEGELARLAEKLELLRQERGERLAELRCQRVALLKVPSAVGSRGPQPGGDAIDDVWDDLPTSHGSASPGRECQRCGEAVPRGRKRFCSRECCQLYMEENGSLENPRRSRFYDYGSHDPEDERWNDAIDDAG
jgi:hypothetical protein